MNNMQFYRNKTDSCLYYRYSKKGLSIIVSWVDNCMILGDQKNVEQCKKELMERFECDNVGEMKDLLNARLKER